MTQYLLTWPDGMEAYMEASNIAVAIENTELLFAGEEVLVTPVYPDKDYEDAELDMDDCWD